MRVRDSEHELSAVEMISSDLLCPQAAAGGTLDFGERIQFFFCDQPAEHRIAEPCRRNEADCWIL